MASNDIYVMRTNGTNVMSVTKMKSNENHPTWAPDGKTLAFVSNTTGATEIFTIGAPTSEGNPVAQPLRQLTFEKAYKANPTWERIATAPTTGSRTRTTNSTMKRPGQAGPLLCPYS
jgi:Tol biopolymer transport system component